MRAEPSVFLTLSSLAADPQTLKVPLPGSAALPTLTPAPVFITILAEVWAEKNAYAVLLKVKLIKTNAPFIVRTSKVSVAPAAIYLVLTSKVADPPPSPSDAPIRPIMAA